MSKFIEFVENTSKKCNTFVKKHLVYYVCFSISIFVIAFFFLGVATKQYLTISDVPLLTQQRLSLSIVLFYLWIITLPTSFENKGNIFINIAYSTISAFIICLDVLYFVFNSEKQSIWGDIFFTIANIFMISFFLHTLISLFRKIFSLLHFLFSKITKTEHSNGLKGTLEAITSVVLSVTALLAAISGIVIAFRELINTFLSQ